MTFSLLVQIFIVKKKKKIFLKTMGRMTRYEIDLLRIRLSRVFRASPVNWTHRGHRSMSDLLTLVSCPALT